MLFDPNSRGLSLRSLFPAANFIHTSDIEVTACSSRATDCQRGDLYVAMETAEGDGHQSWKLAVENGATALLSERLLPTNMPTCVVDDARHAYAQICQALAGNPTDAMCTVGVAGSHGKTTTSLLLESIFRTADVPCGGLNTLRFNDSVDKLAQPIDNPGSVNAATLAARLRQMHGCGSRAAAIEFSAEMLADHVHEDCELDAALITGMRGKDLHQFGSLANYRNIQRRLLEQLKPEGFVVANADDPTTRRLLADCDVPAFTFGVYAQADVTAKVMQMYPGEMEFLLQAGGDAIVVATTMIGEHHLKNCLAAAATALQCGIDLPDIARGLENVRGIPGRLELVSYGWPCPIYVDLADHPDRLAMSLHALKQVTSGRVFCLYDALAIPTEVRPHVGRVLEKSCHLGVINTANTDSICGIDYEPIHQILDGYDAPSKAHLLPDRASAIRWVLESVTDQDVVLLAGRGNQAWSPGGMTDRQLAEGVLQILEAEQESGNRLQDEPTLLKFPTL